jgi:chromosome transmission fidelity protein 18
LKAGSDHDIYLESNKENLRPKNDMAKPETISVKRDFFGRIITEAQCPLGETDGNAGEKRRKLGGKSEHKVWVTFHEGLNNAVTKPISLKEFLRGL